MKVFAITLATVLLISSVPVFMVFGLSSAIVAIWELNLPWSSLIQVAFGSVTKHVLVAVPLFIFAGMAMLRGGAASRLVHFAVTLVGHWPGGLGIAMILAMGFFAAFCGSILAAITAIGTIMIPKMIEQGYPKPFVIVLAASAAFLEALIPPSNAAILFSALTDVPVSKTFAAGILPGLVLMGLLSLVVIWKCRRLKVSERASSKDKLKAFWEALPGLFTPIIILGGIYSGLFTPSESAAVAGLWGIVIGTVIYKELTLTGLVDALYETSRITAIIFAIIAMATFLSVVLTYTQAPQKIINFFLELGGTQVTFWISVAVICLILGTFVEIVPVFYLTVPIFAALALSLNLHVLHLYIVFVAFAGIGMITPPVCVGIYTAAGVAKESPEKAFKEVPLFIFMGIVFGTIMILFPALATWLPSTMNQM